VNRQSVAGGAADRHPDGPISAAAPRLTTGSNVSQRESSLGLVDTRYPPNSIVAAAHRERLATSQENVVR
jgi:hypothetical protein